MVSVAWRRAGSVSVTKRGRRRSEHDMLSFGHCRRASALYLRAAISSYSRGDRTASAFTRGEFRREKQNYGTPVCRFVGPRSSCQWFHFGNIFIFIPFIALRRFQDAPTPAGPVTTKPLSAARIHEYTRNDRPTRKSGKITRLFGSHPSETSGSRKRCAIYLKMDEKMMLAAF